MRRIYKYPSALDILSTRERRRRSTAAAVGSPMTYSVLFKPILLKSACNILLYLYKNNCQVNFHIKTRLK